MSIYLRFLLAAAAIGMTVLITSLSSTPSYGDTAMCIRLVPLQAGREELVNVCNSCRQATVMRSRISAGPPITRKFSLAAKSTLELPFYGPGRARVMEDTACQGTPGAPPNLAAKAKQPAVLKRCVYLARSNAGGVEVVNGCHTCRKVAIRRINKSMTKYADQAFALPGNDIKAVPADGYAHIAVIGEAACY